MKIHSLGFDDNFWHNSFSLFLQDALNDARTINPVREDMDALLWVGAVAGVEDPNPETIKEDGNRLLTDGPEGAGPIEHLATMVETTPLEVSTYLHT